MRKYYTILVAVMIILSAFLCGCDEEKTLNYCSKCSEIASTWIPADGDALLTLDMDFSESTELISGVHVFYLCDDCIEKYGIKFHKVDSPWDDEK